MNHKWVKLKIEEILFKENAEYYNYYRCKNCKLFKAIIKEAKYRQKNIKDIEYFLSWDLENLNEEEDFKFRRCNEVIMESIMK